MVTVQSEKKKFKVIINLCFRIVKSKKKSFKSKSITKKKGLSAKKAITSVQSSFENIEHFRFRFQQKHRR